MTRGLLYVPASINKRAFATIKKSASINKRLPGSINIGIINLAATFSSCLSRVSHPVCRATLGGVALGGLFFNFVFWGFGFLRMGTTGLVAQAFGAGDPHALRSTVARGLLLAFAIGLTVLALQGPLIHYALAAIGGSADVQHVARLYCRSR